MMQIYCFTWQRPGRVNKANEPIIYKETLFNYTRDGAIAEFRKRHADELDGMIKFTCGKFR